MLLQLSYFPHFTPLHPAHLLPHLPPPLQFMSMSHTYKFFGFYISYAILTLPLSIFYLPFMLLILCTFPLSPPPSPLLTTLHVISISVVLFLFQLFAQFAFVFVLGVVVNNCEFAVILLHLEVYAFDHCHHFTPLPPNLPYLVTTNAFSLFISSVFQIPHI